MMSPFVITFVLNLLSLTIRFTIPMFVYPTTNCDSKLTLKALKIYATRYMASFLILRLCGSITHGYNRLRI